MEVPLIYRVGIYARVSTDDKGQSVELQIDRLKEYCKAKGWQIAEIYHEEVSGTGKKERIEFNRLMEDARIRRFDIVLVWKFDRFSREGAYKALEYIKKLEEYGVSFQSMTESFLDTTGSFGKQVLIPLMAWMAEQESIKIRDRVKAGIGRKKQKCENLKIKFKWGKAGYSKEQIDKIIELRPTHTIRQIAEFLNISAGGVHKTLSKIAEMNSEENKPETNLSLQRSNVNKESKEGAEKL